MKVTPDKELASYLRLVGARIRTVRKLLGITQEGMSAHGFNMRYFQKIESGKTNITLGMLYRIAAAFDLQPHELIDPTRRFGARLVHDDTSGVPHQILGTHGAEQAAFRPADPQPEDRFRSCVPLFSLAAAAGGFSTAAGVEIETWVVPNTQLPLHEGMFVARVVGHSMEPAIPSGSFCLFRHPVAGSRQGRILLVEHRDIHDPDHGGSYTVKRYRSEKRAAPAEEGGWCHQKITLLSNNPAYAPIVLVPSETGQVRVIAELVAVLDGIPG